MMVHLTRDLVELLLEHLIVPSASSLGDVDGVTQTLKRGIVSYVLDCGDAPKDALARIFDKSDRWIYRQLEEMDGRKDRRHLGEDHAGYDLIHHVVLFYAQAYPREAPVQACVHALRRQKIPITVQELEPTLNLCVDQGYLTRVTVEVGEHKETLYRSSGPGTLVGNAQDFKTRKLKLSNRVKSLVPMMRSYLQGDPLAKSIIVKMGLPPEKMMVFNERLERYIVELLTELQKEVDEETGGRKVDFPETRLFLLTGPGPFSPGS